MTLNIDLEDVPDAILEAVKARILANRRRLLDQQEQQQRPALQPKPQFRKFGADSKTWKRPQPAAVPSGNGWLLVPTGPWQSSLQGFLCVVSGLPNRPFLTPVEDFEYADNKLRIKTKTENGQKLINSYGSYSTQGSQSVPGKILQSATFEGFIDMSGVAPTAVSGFYDFIGYWEYEYVVSIFDPGGAGLLTNPYQQTRYLRSTSPSGVRRPDPPSVHFTWPQIATDDQGEVQTITSFVSETLIYTTPPEVQEVFVNAYPSLSVTITFAPANEGDEPSLVFTGNLGGQVSSEPGSTDTIASVDVNGESQWLSIGSAGSQRLHYAFAVTPETITGYIDGQSLLTVQNPGINPQIPYNIEVTVSAGAQDFDQVLEVPDSPFTLGDSVISEGYMRVADASRHSVSGIRFTPSRALYSGSSFTPPTSINSLA